MTVVRADFDTRRTVADRLTTHIENREREDQDRDGAIRAALQNEYLTRMRFERFLAASLLERVKWVILGSLPKELKKPEAKPAEPEAPKMQVVAGDGEVSNG